MTVRCTSAHDGRGTTTRRCARETATHTTPVVPALLTCVRPYGNGRQQVRLDTGITPPEGPAETDAVAQVIQDPHRLLAKVSRFRYPFADLCHRTRLGQAMDAGTPVVTYEGAFAVKHDTTSKLSTRIRRSLWTTAMGEEGPHDDSRSRHERSQ